MDLAAGSVQKSKLVISTKMNRGMGLYRLLYAMTQSGHDELISVHTNISAVGNS